MRSLKDILTIDFGIDLTGWQLERAIGISQDGLTIVGWGTNPNGSDEVFIATLPEPGALVMATLGIPWLLHRHR